MVFSRDYQKKNRFNGIMVIPCRTCHNFPCKTISSEKFKTNFVNHRYMLGGFKTIVLKRNGILWILKFRGTICAYCKLWGVFGNYQLL